MSRMRKVAGRVGTAAFGCAMGLPFVGLAAFFAGAGGVTVACAAVPLAALGLSAFFEEGITWLLAPVALAAGGVGALAALLLGGSVLYAAAFAACLTLALVIALFFLLVARLSR